MEILITYLNDNFIQIKNRIPPNIIIGIPIAAPITVSEINVPIIMFIRPIAFLDGFQYRGNTTNTRSPNMPQTISSKDSSEES